MLMGLGLSVTCLNIRLRLQLILGLSNYIHASVQSSIGVERDHWLKPNRAKICFLCRAKSVQIPITNQQLQGNFFGTQILTLFWHFSGIGLEITHYVTVNYKLQTKFPHKIYLDDDFSQLKFGETLNDLLQLFFGPSFWDIDDLRFLVKLR